MILGSKYLKIYPDPVQVTPSGLTVSISKLRSPGGMKTAEISGPVKFLNQIFESMHARDCLDSMKGMLLTLSTYRPTLEYFPKPSYISNMVDEDIPGISEMSDDSDKEEEVKDQVAQEIHYSTTTDLSTTRLDNSCMDIPVLPNNSNLAKSTGKTCASCGVTVQGELQKFMEMQEAGLKTEFRCKQCRSCDDCRRGAGHETRSRAGADQGKCTYK